MEEDPRFEAVRDALPGANCGGCGYAGCEGYAIAVVNDPAISAALCVAGSEEVSIAVGELTGKTVVLSCKSPDEFLNNGFCANKCDDHFISILGICYGSFE